ncbi:hypothetical protein, partial [Pseudomonas sp. 43(2021)]|uniref:hypothetical protein n=1 Tax=Pseudomonas sp. 43(2021) TaxID=2813560 RepID=UPI001FAFAA0C
MVTHELGRKETQKAALNSDARERVIAVARPETVHARQHTVIGSSAPGGATLDLHSRKRGAQPIEQRIKRLGLTPVSGHATMASRGEISV